MNAYALALAVVIAQASSCSPNMSPAQPDSGPVAEASNAASPAAFQAASASSASAAPASDSPASATPEPGTSASPASASPAASPPASVTPSATLSPATPSPAPTPSASPLYKFHYTPKAAASPDPSAAQILEVDLNDDHLQPHGKIEMRVLTSANVVKVQTQSNGQTGTLVQDGPGEFSATGNLPGIPFIARGWKINLEFIATTADGHKASVKVPVTLG